MLEMKFRDFLRQAEIWSFLGGLKPNIGHFLPVLGHTFFLPPRGNLHNLTFMRMCQGLVEGRETNFFSLESPN